MFTGRSQKDLLFALGALALAGLTSAGCENEDLLGTSDGFTDHEWTQIRALEPLVGSPPDNPFNEFANDEAAAALGQMLFFDPEFSTAVKVDGPSGKTGDKGKVSCVTCHDPNKYFIDSRTTEGSSHGVDYTPRTSPPTLNLAWYQWITWAGRLDSMSMQAANAPEAPTDVNGNRLAYAHLLYAKYRDEYNALFYDPLPDELDPMHPDAAKFPAAGKPKAAMTDPNGVWEMLAAAEQGVINRIMSNAGKAMDAYERKLITPNSRFQNFVKGLEKLTGQEMRGLKLFIGKAACNECHTGSILSDNKFHNVGVPQSGPRIPRTDDGRYQDIPKLLGNPHRSEGTFSADREAGTTKLDHVRNTELIDPMDASKPQEWTRGQFRTPSLLNIAETAPYFHNGSARSLEDVIDFYNQGGGEVGTFSGTKDVRMVPLGLTAAEKGDLVAFLKTLTGEHPPEPLRQPTHKPPLPPPPPPPTTP